jgi:hypothetical protein
MGRAYGVGSAMIVDGWGERKVNYDYELTKYGDVLYRFYIEVKDYEEVVTLRTREMMRLPNLFEMRNFFDADLLFPGTYWMSGEGVMLLTVDELASSISYTKYSSGDVSKYLLILAEVSEYK